MSELRPLRWSQVPTGNFNGQVGGLTFYVVAFHANGEGWQVHPKLPGQKTVRVNSPGEGKAKAVELYRAFLRILIAEGEVLP